MNPVEVEIRRNQHGSVLTYSDRDRAARLLEDHRGVLQSLYRLVDRRHGSDGEVVARLEVREDARVVDDLDVRERFRRDLEADRALSVVDDVRHHAGEGELVTDGGEKVDGEIDQDHRSAKIADEKPKQPCQFERHGRPCGNEAVKAGFARTDSVVNQHGVHVTTETRVVWVCEEHANVYPTVPDRGASVRGRE